MPIIVYRGSRMQRGSGMGDMLRKTFKRLLQFSIPIAKQAYSKAAPVVKRAAKEAVMTAGTKADNELLQRGKSKASKLSKSSNPVKAIAGNAAQAGLETLGQKRKASAGPPGATKKRKPVRKSAKKGKKKRITKTIFDQ